MVEWGTYSTNLDESKTALSSSCRRFGDMVWVAILQSRNDDEMTTLEALTDVLLIVLLDQLRNHTRGRIN